jgi:hypothetical protein
LVILCVILVWVGRYSIELNGDRVDAGDILAGFGDDALIAITALMILACGLETTNALQPVGRALAELWRIRPKLAFITDSEPAQAVPELSVGDGEKVLAVYLPMSYQIGGYALFLPERCLQRIEMPVEEAMRMVLTAGVNRPRAENPQAQQPVA